MNEEHRRQLREADLAFFGRIGADVSHEMRNVLAVVGEYAGLMEDTLGLAGRFRKPDCAKLEQLCAKIARKVRDGTETMERFSSFAHVLDDQTEACDLAAVTKNMVALARQRVAMTGCGIETELPDEAVPVRAHPFAAQHAVFAALELLLDSVEQGGCVRIALAVDGPAAVMRMSGSAADAADLSGKTSQLSGAMEELQGSVETAWTDGTLELALAIPLDRDPSQVDSR